MLAVLFDTLVWLSYNRLLLLGLALFSGIFWLRLTMGSGLEPARQFLGVTFFVTFTVGIAETITQGTMMEMMHLSHSARFDRLLLIWTGFCGIWYPLYVSTQFWRLYQWVSNKDQNLSTVKFAEESQRRRLMEAAVETLPHGVLFASQDLRIVFANARFHRSLGYDYGELIGQKLSVLVNTVYVDDLDQLTYSKFGGRQVDPFVIFPVNKHGDPLDFTLRLSSTNPVRGQVYYTALIEQEH